MPSKFVDDGTEQDQPRVDDGYRFVVVSNDGLLKYAAHYLIHGNEWMLSRFDEYARTFLRQVCPR